MRNIQMRKQMIRRKFFGAIPGWTGDPFAGFHVFGNAKSVTLERATQMMIGAFYWVSIHMLKCNYVIIMGH